MNADIKELFAGYVAVTRDTPAAALPVLADVLSRPAPAVADPAGSNSLTVQQSRRPTGREQQDCLLPVDAR